MSIEIVDLEAAGMSREHALEVLDDLFALHQWAYGLFLDGTARRDPSPLIMDALTIVSMALGEGPPWTNEAMQRSMERSEARSKLLAAR
jgi:hypothetical protein